MRIGVFVTSLLPFLHQLEFRSVEGGLGALPMSPILVAVVLLLSIDLKSRCLLPRNQVWMFLAVAALGGVALPAPISSSSLVWGGACLGALITNRLALGPVVGLAMLAAMTVHWLAPSWLSWFEAPRLMGPLCAGLLRASGVQATLVDEGLAISGPDGGAVYRIDWVRSGGRCAISLLTATLVLVSVFEKSKARTTLFWRVALALTAGCIGTLAAGVAMMSQGALPSLVDDAWVRSLFMGVPLLGVLGGVAQPRLRSIDSLHFQTRGAVSLFASLTALGVVIFGGGPSSAPEEVVVAIDEGHSEWERIDLPLDREHYGSRAVYNYSEWMRGIEARYSDVRRLSEKIAPEVLLDVDVLILKTPTEPLAKDEVDAIHDYVNNGGGLYLVGDHTNVFGMNTILNSVSQEFGIHYRSDGLFEVDYDGGQVSDPSAFPPHDLLMAMKPMRWMTSCSLDVSLPAKPILWSSYSYGDSADYATGNFFGDKVQQPDERSGALVQAAVAGYGRGRVLAFTDSTLFSNFSIFLPGVRELAFIGLEWLCREPLLWPRALLLLVALIVLGISFSAGPPDGLLLGGSILAAVLGSLGLVRLAGSGLNLPREGVLFDEEVVVDAVVGGGALPVWHQSHDGPTDIWSAFVALQRAGNTPRVALEHSELFEGSVAVIWWPRDPLPRGFVRRAVEYVESGGRLLVFDDGWVEASAVSVMAGAFGMQVETIERPRILAAGSYDAEGGLLRLGRPTLAIHGGRYLLTDEDGVPLVSGVRQGDGAAVFCGAARDFSDSVLGDPHAIPFGRNADLYRLLFSIFDGALTMLD